MSNYLLLKIRQCGGAPVRRRTLIKSILNTDIAKLIVEEFGVYIFA